MGPSFGRLAVIANETAKIAAELEELELLREQVRRAERAAGQMLAIAPNGANRRGGRRAKTSTALIGRTEPNSFVSGCMAGNRRVRLPQSVESLQPRH